MHSGVWDNLWEGIIACAFTFRHIFLAIGRAATHAEMQNCVPNGMPNGMPGMYGNPMMQGFGGFDMTGGMNPMMQGFNGNQRRG